MLLAVRAAYRLIHLGLLALIVPLAACQTGEREAAPAGDLATIQARLTGTAVAAAPRVAAPPSATPIPALLLPSPTLPPLAPTATAAPPRPAATTPPRATPTTLEDATARQAIGDYGAAVSGYRAIIAAQPGTEAAKRAQFHLGQVEMQRGNSLAAGIELTAFVQAYPADALAAPAWFMLGRLLYAAKQWDAAADAYGRYVALGGPLADYAQNRVGNAHAAAKRHEAAARAYEAAAQRPNVSQPVIRAAWHGLGDSRLAQGDRAGAQAAYQRAFDLAADDEDRAAAVYALVQLHQQTGDTAAARNQLRRLWTEYPRTEAAYSAVRADADGGQVDLMHGKGMAAYYRGDNARAVAAFNRAADSDAGHPADTHLYAGLAYRRLRQYRSAVFHFDQLIDTHPGDPLMPDALLGKARALRLTDQSQSLAVYDDLLKRYPEFKNVGDAALEAAELKEEMNECAGAIPRYAAAARYGGAAGTEAQARLGVCQLRVGDTGAAITTWQALESAPQAERRAQAYYWHGKTVERAGDRAGAQELYRKAIAASPVSLYGARAAQVLGAVPPVAADASTRAAAEGWLLTQTAKTAADLAAAQAAVQQDADVLRARALYEQGMREAAALHIRLARNRWAEDALRLYHLARAANEMSGYTVGMGVAESLGGVLKTGLVGLPPYIQTLAFPRPYRALVEGAASRYAIDAALFYAIMRQESRFEPQAQSVADARGLSQVLPSTGEGIARAIGWKDFSAADLFKPYVNVEFGAYYLAQQMKRFEGQTWAALAAYNAGPNAVPRWRSASNDPDFQIEAIDYDETALYVRRVMGYWAMYQTLYPAGMAREDEAP